MKNNILTTTLLSLAIALTAIATTGCGNSGKQSDLQEGEPEYDLLVEISPTQIISRWKKNPTDTAFDTALHAVDSVKKLGAWGRDDWDYGKEFCEFYVSQKPSADFYNTLDLPGLNPGATIPETAEAINSAIKNEMAETAIPALKKRLKDAGATYIDIAPAVRHFSTLRVFVGGLDDNILWPLIASKGNIDFRIGGGTEAKEALAEIDGRCGNRLSSMSNTWLGYGVIGHFRQADKNEADSIINSEEARAILPPGISLHWSYSPENYGDGFYSLYALKEANVPASGIGQYITESIADCDELAGWYVSIKFNDTGAEILERLTGDNIGEVIAIVLDDKVLSAPRVNDRITGGNSQITGFYDEQTCKLFAAVFNGGTLPYDCEIISLLPYKESEVKNEFRES